LVIHKDGAIVLPQIHGRVIGERLEPQKSDHGDVLPMADFSPIDHVYLDIELSTDELVGKTGRDSVGIRVVMENDDMVLSPVGLKDVANTRARLATR
jgi:hypothetical protein